MMVIIILVKKITIMTLSMMNIIKTKSLISFLLTYMAVTTLRQMPHTKIDVSFKSELLGTSHNFFGLTWLRD